MGRYDCRLIDECEETYKRRKDGLFFLMCLLYSVAILLRSRRPFLSSTGRGCVYSPNPQRHHLVLFHRMKERKDSKNVYKSAFFSLMSYL